MALQVEIWMWGWIGEDIVGFSGMWNGRSAGVGVGIGMGIWTGAGQNRRCVICVFGVFGVFGLFVVM